MKVGRRFRGLFLTAAIGVGIAVAPTATAEPAPGCSGWQVDTVASDLEELENLEPDGQGGFYLSGRSRVYHIDAAGEVTTVLENLRFPRGLQLVGTDLYVVTGSDGALSRYDTGTGELTYLATMTVPNGLLRLPDGDFLTTWIGTDFGVPHTGVTRYRHETGAVETKWSPIPRSEGLALSLDRQSVYTDDLFTGQVINIPLATPDRWTVVATVPGLFPGLDDLTITNSGELYVAAHVEGAIHRVDPVTGATCRIASGLSSGWTGPSSVRIGPDGAGFALYVTVFDGTLRRLRPPPGTDLTPVHTA
ncbi:SMP-30/gluconolactonase/LRE family protein [Nocardia bovistercoris]|uniref:SMP-30/gluconolactonase/LRE family protein n=1 Tax=Nocardia bovistercoris TaxID=2785916 RepID=A0A931I8J4_9NOCA|nr:SMP-30/gluconolactonase/LRE family protein [Nocardia bovistercoris]MBH0776086.1 SMP-30/gluconolactonase/LRE family protein [Nocardia bovistercoris]